MPTRTYNQFFEWIKEDDFLAIWPNFIEWYNVTWLREGYWLTLWPKMNKQLLTNTAPRAIFGRERGDLTLDDMAVWCDGWEIYKLTSTDNTPIDTLTNAWDIVNWELFLKWSNFMYFASKQPWAAFTSARLMQVTLSDFQNETFASKNESFLSFNNIHTPPMFQDGSFLYVGGLNTVYQIDSAWVTTSFGIFNRYIVWITKVWTQFRIYTDEKELAIWDGVSSSVSAKIPLWFRPERIVTDNWIDHIISSDWDYWVWSWYSFQNVTKTRKSLRLNDNSQFTTKFDFTPSLITWNSLEPVKSWMYMLSSDTKPWIYRKDKLIQWLPSWFNKSITRDNTNVEFSELFTLRYISRWQTKLFIWFENTNNVFWVDFIDISSKETAKDWYIVSDVFSWWTAFEKEIEVIRFAQSFNGNQDDYIKLYKRIDNWAWEEISLTKPLDDKIIRENLTLVTDEWIDIQFKIEIHNESQDDSPPIFHELSHLYNVIKR